MTTTGLRRHPHPALRLALLGSALLSIPQLLGAEDVPSCSAPEVAPALARWHAIRRSPTAAWGEDRNRFLVPTATASDDCNGRIDFTPGQSGRLDDGIHAWIYASRCKETVCGVPESHEYNFNSFLAGEHDFNNNIRIEPSDSPTLTSLDPGGRAEALLDRHECFEDLSVGHDLALDGGSLCFEKPIRGWLVHAEITPPAGRRKALEEVWLPEARHAQWRGLLTDREMCVYGPLAGDTGHGLKLEIHPAQLLWWNRNQSPRRSPPDPYVADGPYDLLVIQDGSSRFQREHRFVVRDEFPKGSAWRPWAQAPVEGHFEIPFWIEAAPVVGAVQAAGHQEHTRCGEGPNAAFAIEPWRACQDGPWLTEPVECRKQLASRTGPPLYVESHAARDEPNAFTSQVRWLCRCEGQACGGAAGYLGFLEIDAAVGVPRDFEEGALGLTVHDTRIAAPALLECKPHGKQRRGAQAGESAAASVPAAASIRGQVRRVLDDERGKHLLAIKAETQDQRQRAMDQGFLAKLLEDAGWPASRPAPGVLEFVRPMRMTLEARSRLKDVSDEDQDNLQIEETWDRVEVCPLPGDCAPVVVNKRARRVRIALPEITRPLVVRATVTLRLKDKRTGRSTTHPFTQRLWADRLRLDPDGLEDWLNGARDICGGTALPAALEDLLFEALERKELSVTTLALLARAAEAGCETPSMKRRSRARPGGS